MVNCIKCGNPIDMDDDPLLLGRCKKCTDDSKAFIECIFCENVDLLKTPPCSLDFVYVKDGKCLDFTRKISTNDLILLFKKCPHLFDLVN